MAELSLNSSTADPIVGNMAALASPTRPSEVRKAALAWTIARFVVSAILTASEIETCVPWRYFESSGKPGDTTFAASTLLYDKHRISLENLNNLGSIPATGAYVLVGGTLNRAGSGSPATIFGLVPRQ